MNLDYSFMNPFLLFFLGMISLYFSSEIIINQSVLISNKFNVSKLLVGVFIMAFGTSLPELFVSIIAILKDSDGIVIGNIVGSNIANIGLVFGVALLMKPMVIKHLDNAYRLNLFSLSASSVLFVIFLYDNVLSRSDGIILSLSCLIYLFLFINYFSIDNQSFNENESSDYSVLKLFFGFILIYFGSDFFVNGALGISKSLGIQDVAVGMTIVSIGTSAPELFTTMLALRNNENNLALGNIIGSNIFNVLLVGGISSIIANINISFHQISIHLILLLSITLALTLLIILLKKINKVFGIIFISIYLIFILINFYNFN